MDTVIRLYGTYLGKPALAWVGFAERLDYDFVCVSGKFYIRRTDYGKPYGWGDRYTISAEKVK